ncbi:MAG: T9SS type A sorting domain-containing protein [Bacteroidales bacterium]
MKKMQFSHVKFTLFLSLAMVFLPVTVLSQIEYGGDPFARKYPSAIKSTDQAAITLSLSQDQKDEREYQLGRESFMGDPLHAGFTIPANINPRVHGEWQEFGDSLRIWRAQIESPEAKGIGLILRNYQLSENAAIFVYDPVMENVLGSFNHKNNNEHQILSIRMVPGEQVIVEYQEKITGNDAPLMMNSDFYIESIMHVTSGLIDVNNEKGLGDAGDCQVNINCSEGDLWQRQKRGVARILMRVDNSLFWCSGSLVNTTAQDGRPYFLTAHHCGDEASLDDYLQWQFYFNLEHPGCENSGMPYHNVLYGASLLANGPMEGGSDFKLLQLGQMPPPSWQVYYNGWNRIDEPATSGAGIHHPKGDVKKISTFDQVLTSAGPTVSGEQMAENSTWRVNWIETENGFGVVEGGSSGSPLFNQQGLIVGTLTGGSSSCNNTANPDYYGKLSFHWDQNGDFYYDQLALWLDPLGTGITTLPGYDPSLAQYPPPGFVEAQKLENESIELRWYKPGQTPNKPGWYSYVNTYQGYIWAGPERANVFDAKTFGLSYPITLSKVSHIFYEDPESPWPNNEFRFKIYDQSGSLLLYQSPVIEAESLVEMVHELEEPLEMNDKFYVSVAPVHSSGNPASLFENINYGNGVSFTGIPGNWQVAGNNSNQYVFITKIFIDMDENGKEEEYTASSDDITVMDYSELMFDNESTLLNMQILPRWSSSVTTYRIYRNNELLEEISTSELMELLYLDESGPSGNIYDSYYITAVYPDDVESNPSNKVFIFNEALCETVIQDFPWVEDFAEGQLPDCWTVESDGPGWEIGPAADLDTLEILPYTNSNFAFIKSDEDSDSDAWIISPPFNISELATPAIRFWFNTSFNRELSCQLELYVSTSDGIFLKLWDAGDHPLFNRDNAFTWMNILEDLTEYKAQESIRFAFLSSCDQNSFFAIDNIGILDADELVYPLTLIIDPVNEGEVYGAGSYIAGQKVIVEASPNTGLFFQHWLVNDEIVSKRARYDFLMPEEALEITAFFDPQSTVSVNEVQQADDQIRVYPNPSSGKLNMYFITDRNNINIRVFNAAGQLVLSLNEPYIAGQTNIELDLSGNPKGLYLIDITDEYTRQVKKVNITN